MTIKEAKIYIRKELSNIYPKNELSAFIRIIFSDVFELNFTETIIKENDILADEECEKIKSIVKRLNNFEPLQYIIGFTEFYELKFMVSPDVLIPRPETEELVDLIIKENTGKTGLKVLDIGTGSGCIAVSLAKNLPEPEIFALDVSKKALTLAESNALINRAKIAFVQGDILNYKTEKFFAGDDLELLPQSGGLKLSPRKDDLQVSPQKDNLKLSPQRDDLQLSPRRDDLHETFDIIVSNPPYVTLSEKEKTEKNVKEYEPEIALFVEDENPLIFYRVITGFAEQQLSENGKLYFEINEKFGKEVKDILCSFGFSGVKIIKDINGKERIVKGVKK